MSVVAFTQSANKEFTQSANKQRGASAVVPNLETDSMRAWSFVRITATTGQPPSPVLLDPSNVISTVAGNSFSLFPVTPALPTKFTDFRAYYYPTVGGSNRTAPFPFAAGTDRGGGSDSSFNMDLPAPTASQGPAGCLPDGIAASVPVTSKLRLNQGNGGALGQISGWVWSASLQNQYTESDIVAQRARWRVNFKTTAFIASADVWAVVAASSDISQPAYPLVYGWQFVPPLPGFDPFLYQAHWGHGLRNVKLLQRDIAITAQQFYEVPMPSTQNYSSPLTAGFVGSIVFMVHTMTPEEWQAKTGFVLQGA
jgi:hypothetical protein